MVAYSFAPQFEEEVATLKKCLTVRGNRKRHARPGEAIQLYAGLRTKFCRKLVDIDPICLDVRPIHMDFGTQHPLLIKAITIDGTSLNDQQIEEFAVADGFGSALASGFARRRMGEYWLGQSPWAGFIGVVIRWEHQRG